MKLKFVVKKVETFKCMNEQCGFQWTGEAGPGKGNCPKCDSVYYEWTNFNSDWELNEDNHWKRK